MQLLSQLEHQNNTMECVNVADNPGRINLARFRTSMSRFSKIRRLDLSRITRTSGDETLIEAEIMLTWRLEELVMNGVPMNDKTLDTIATYLVSEMSESLRVLKMDQCNLNGSQVALLMRAMTRQPGQGRNLELHISANRLEKGVGNIIKAIEENHTPTHLVVRMIEFAKEDHFRQLLQALCKNTTIRSLDISKASLPYDAGPETCDALREMFATNATLEDLDISGEHAHLEVTRFGIGLNQALTGLKNNKSLKVLRIEYQNIGLEGANTLSSVLEGNKSLTHVYCEHNDINLQGFTILVNAMAKNYTVLDLPFMQDDQGESLKRMSANMRETRRATTIRSDNASKSSVRRTLGTLGTTFAVARPAKVTDMTPQDLDAVVRVLGERWDVETQRLAVFLDRNRNIAAGIDVDAEALDEEVTRPTTAMSDHGILEQVLNNTTPKVELGNPVETQFATKVAGLSLGTSDGERGAKGEENERAEDDTTPRKKKRDTIVGPLSLPDINRDKTFEVESMFDME